jgi:hypothetical protein
VFYIVNQTNEGGSFSNRGCLFDFSAILHYAHLQKDVSLLLKDISADFIEVNRGLIKKPAHAESRIRFHTYFEAVEFIKWDDATPPLFTFSDDGTMATSLVDKLVITKQKALLNKLDTARYAWLAVYQKINGKWRMHRMSSTNR